MKTTSSAVIPQLVESPAMALGAKLRLLPTPLGLQKSFGFGDRLGLATPGHLAAARKFGFAPVLAQQSIREMERTRRTPQEVIESVRLSLDGYAGVWGADADHLKLPEHVVRTAAAGFCMFTIDPSEYVGKGALTPELESIYAGKEFDRETLRRAAVKYARALEHVALMGHSIAAAMGSRPFEIEVSVDETDEPTSGLEHLFIAKELKRLKVPNVVSVAPRFVGEFEKGIDYKGDLRAFEVLLREHVEIAKQWGPYKISMHSGSDKFAVYPIFGRVCGELFHVKTAGTSYLEALRVVARTDARLFAEIVEFCRGRFEADRNSYHICTTQAHVNGLPRFAGNEATFLDEVTGRQLLHVTFGSVLTHSELKGRMMDVLHQHADLHEELLDRHFTRHLSLLTKG